MSANRITYVLDTSVLLADPRAIHRFDEHDVVVPLVVVSELEAKRGHPDLGFTAREALRQLEDLRVTHGVITTPVPSGKQGGTIRIEVGYHDLDGLPLGLRDQTNDHRILAVANHLARTKGNKVVVVSKDLPLRLKAAVCDMSAEEYRNEQVADSGWAGFTQLEVSPNEFEVLARDGVGVIIDADRLPCHTSMVITCTGRSLLGRIHPDGLVHVIRGAREVFGMAGRSAEQRAAIDILLDDRIGVVSLGGKAGTGKSLLAVAAGLEAVMERRTHKRVIVFRPLYAVGDQQLGFMPGSEAEKMAGPSQAVFDVLGAITSPEVVRELMARDKIEVAPLTNIRGRTISNAWIVVDEAQNLERSVLVAALTRLGAESRLVLTHDVSQRDNLRVGRHDGIASVVEKLKGDPLFAHISLTRSERSPVAEMAAALLDDEA